MNPEPLSGRRDRLSVRAPPAMGRGQRDRQDHRQQRDHRPRRRQARPQAGRDPGRVQMVRRRPDRRLVRLRRRGKRRRLVPAARRHRCGPPTRTASFSGLLAAEMTARTGRDPEPVVRRADRANSACRSTSGSTRRRRRRRRTLLKALSPDRLGDHGTGRRAGARRCSTTAPGNGQSFGGIKVVADNGWFAARPSGTEDVYKIYAESFRSESHLRQIQSEAQSAIAQAFEGSVAPVRRPETRLRIDDIQMDAAAARASQGPVFAAGLAADDAQHRQAGVALRTVGAHRAGPRLDRYVSWSRHRTHATFKSGQATGCSSSGISAVVP